jgi:hypothetical protein
VQQQQQLWQQQHTCKPPSDTFLKIVCQQLRNLLTGRITAQQTQRLDVQRSTALTYLLHAAHPQPAHPLHPLPSLPACRDRENKPHPLLLPLLLLLPQLSLLPQLPVLLTHLLLLPLLALLPLLLLLLLLSPPLLPPSADPP